MFKNYFTLFISLALSANTFFSATAQTKPLNITTTAVPFLRINPDARSGGMGEVGIATSADPNSSFLNNAKFTSAKNKSGISASYVPWLRGLGLKDVYFTSLAGYLKLDETQAISGSFKYFSLGDIQFTDENANNLSSYRPKEFSFDAGYARKLSNKLSLGIAVRYIHSKLANGTYNGQTYKAGSAVAGDISLFHDGTSSMTSTGFNYGLTLSNLGSKISYTSNADRKDFLPANLGVGFAYTRVFNESTKLTVGLDVNKLLVPTPPRLSGNDTKQDSMMVAEYRNRGVLSGISKSFNDGPGQIALGGEVMFQDQFTFRSGYFYETRSKGGRRYFTVGGGLSYTTFGINFSFIIPSGSYAGSRSPLENTLKTSVLFNFGNR